MLPFMYRIASGYQNAFGYAGMTRARVMMSTVMVITCGVIIAAALVGQKMPAWYIVATCLLCCVAIASAIGVEDSFNDSYQFFPPDVHLYETLTTASLTLAICTAGGNILLVASSVYPGLIIHKAVINYSFNLPWHYHGTDDKTGKTYGIPLLGIVVFRSSFAFRVTAAVISLALAALAMVYGWGIYLAPLRITI